MSKEKLGEVRVSGAEIKRIMARGPIALMEDVKSYVNDCNTLFERMQDLYKECIPAQLVGIRVHLIVDADKGPTFFDVVFGATEPASTEEEAEKKFEELEL